MNLVEMAEKWSKGLYKNDNELKQDLDKITIFQPIEAESEDEDSIYHDPQRNSWTDVNTYLLYKHKITEEQYKAFYDKVKELKK